MDLIIHLSIIYILARVILIMFGVPLSLFACLFVCFLQVINIDQDKQWWVLRKILVPPNISQQQEPSLLNLFECIGSCQNTATIHLIRPIKTLSGSGTALTSHCTRYFIRRTGGERRLRPDVLIVRHSCNPTPLSQDIKRAPL